MTNIPEISERSKNLIKTNLDYIITFSGNKNAKGKALYDYKIISHVKTDYNK